MMVICFIPMEVIVVLSHRRARARQGDLHLRNMLLLPSDNVLLRVQLIPNVFGMLETLQVLIVRVRLQRLLLVQRVVDGGLRLLHLLDIEVDAFLRHVLRRDRRGGHYVTRVIVAVQVLLSLVLRLTVRVQIVFGSIDQIFRLYSLNLIVPNHSGLGAKIVLRFEIKSFGWPNFWRLCALH